MPSYKLSYFETRGAAENIRMLFKLANVEFVDERLSRDKWPDRKAGMPLQAMPVLEVDGKQFCQSNAIARYVAKTFNLMGADTMEEFQVDELMEVLAELSNKMLMKVFYEQDEEKKKEMIKGFATNDFKLYRDFFLRRLKENTTGSGFFVGKSVTLGDIAVYNIFDLVSKWWGNYGYDVLEGCQELQDHCSKVKAIPAIAKWLKERPDTPF